MPEIRAEVVQVGQTPASEGRIREHRLLIDRPAGKGGTDRGPMGGEMLLTALGGCFLSNLIAALAARELAAEDLRVAVTGTLEGSPPRYTRIVARVSGGGVERATLEKLVRMSERACIVANTLRDAVTLDIAVG